MIDGRECNVGFFTDITEHKRIEDELEKYKGKVFKTQRHAYIGSMGAIVAHQVNQPLTKINILLDRALDNAEDGSCSPVVIKDIKKGLAEVKKAVSIIRKFRQHSKDFIPEGVGKVNLSAVADRIVSVLSQRAKQAKMRISTKGLANLPEVEINETALEQIFFIIIQNAIEAADDKKPHKLDIIGKFTDGNIELRFSDDCCGIAPENIDKIFEPFFSTKTEDKGMGLGLNLVQQILINCGGQIRVESRLDSGTTFYVTLPISNTVGA
jgi:C4-dicarboxylate-specific signal transduction histidine kinase